MISVSYVRRHALSASFAGILLLAACGAEDPQKMLESARDYQANNDQAAAIIQLKNALQQAPDLAEARYRLGLALSLTGDWAGAESELEKARKAGYPIDEVAPVLARSRLVLGEFKKLTDDFSQLKLAVPMAQADLKTTVAAAWRQQGDMEAYRAALNEALEASPSFAPARVEQARSQAAAKDVDAALGTLETILKENSTQADALKFKGDLLLMGKGDAENGLLAYRAALEAQPKLLEARVGVVRSLLHLKRIDAASDELGILAKSAGGHPQTLYLQGQVAFQKGDFTNARQYAQQLLKLSPDHPAALELNGVAEFRLDSLVNAEASLARAVQGAPELTTARRVLLMIYLRTGQVDKAIAALPADLDSGDTVPAMLAIAGQAYMVKGNLERAEQLFAQSAKLDPEDPAKRTSLAVSQLMSGKTELAMASLEGIAASDTGIGADMALINTYMRQGDTGKALAAIDTLQKKRPKEPQTFQLRGRALLASNDRVGARKAFEHALVVDPDYFAATAALAAVDILDGKPDAARQRLEALVARNPKNAQALMALAELRAREGGAKEAVADLIRKAVEAAPADMAPHVMLVDHYLRQNDAKAALTAASAAAVALPDAPEVLDALGRAQMAGAEFNQAMGTFNKMAGQMPRSPLPYLRLATVQVASKDHAAAEQSLRKALDIQPELLPAQKGLIDLYLAAGQADQALVISSEVQKQRPKASVGYVLEGDIYARLKSWSQAALAYRTALKIEALAEPLIKLHTSLTQSGKTAEADRVAADWMKSYPADAAVPLYLGDRAIASTRLQDAQRYLERVIELQPGNAVALNNLAWVAGKLGRADAVALAEKAVALAPNQPAFMDTLAMLLSAKGDHKRAIELQMSALEKAPGMAAFKLNLARIYLKSGDKVAARSLLNELAALGETFAEQGQVQKLLQELS